MQLQAIHLMENVEKFGFYAGDNIRLHEIKSQMSAQMRNFSFDVTAKGYFTLNRRLLTAVSYKMLQFRHQREEHDCRFFQIASGCCTYIIILIQFSTSTDCSKRSDCAALNGTNGRG